MRIYFLDKRMYIIIEIGKQLNDKTHLSFGLVDPGV